jgi:hypothetical protein
MNEEVARIALQAGQVFQFASVGQLVEVENRLVSGGGIGRPVEHKVATNEADTACCKHRHINTFLKAC